MHARANRLSISTNNNLDDHLQLTHQGSTEYPPQIQSEHCKVVGQHAKICFAEVAINELFHDSLQLTAVQMMTSPMQILHPVCILTNIYTLCHIYLIIIPWHQEITIYICYQASKNQPCEHKLHQVIISLIFSVQNKLWYFTSVSKPIKFCSSSEDFVEVV